MDINILCSVIQEINTVVYVASQRQSAHLIISFAFLIYFCFYIYFFYFLINTVKPFFYFINKNTFKTQCVKYKITTHVLLSCPKKA